MALGAGLHGVYMIHNGSITLVTTFVSYEGPELVILAVAFAYNNCKT